MVLCGAHPDPAGTSISIIINYGTLAVVFIRNLLLAMQTCSGHWYQQYHFVVHISTKCINHCGTLWCTSVTEVLTLVPCGAYWYQQYHISIIVSCGVHQYHQQSTIMV